MMTPIADCPFARFKTSRLSPARARFRRAVLAAALVALPYGCPVSHAQTTPGPADRVSQPIADGETARLEGNVSPRVSESTDLGAVEPEFRLTHVQLMFRPSAGQGRQLEQLLEEQQDRNSPLYHKWLSPEEYADRFGLSRGDIGAVTSWLARLGFTDITTSRTHTFVSFSGSASQFHDAFHTSIHALAWHGEKHFANTSAPSIPMALAPVVAGILGLDDFEEQPAVRRRVAADESVNALTPSLMGEVYDIAPLSAEEYTGSGVTIVIVGQSDIQLSDIASFQSEFGLPGNSPQLVLTGADPGIRNSSSNDSEFEADLDLEWASAVAPGSRLIYDYAKSAFSAMTDAIDNKRGQIISVSFASCEPLEGAASMKSYEQQIQTANAEGITVLAASGDTGAAGCDQKSATVATQGLAVSFPASSPEVTAVGGTEFTYGFSNATQYVAETAWNDTSQDGHLAATGGGESIEFSKPSWQAVPGVGTDNFRYLPDVALSAGGVNEPYTIVSEGSTEYAVGTSAGTPSWAGLLALINQYLVANGLASAPGLGNANPMLYNLSQSSGPVFQDITTGNNKVPCEAKTPDCPSGGTIGYSATTGFDETTGLGSPDVYQMAQWWGYLEGKPSLQVSTKKLAFSSVGTGFSSDPQAVVLTNSGTGLVTVQIAFAGTDASSFTEADTCGTPREILPGNQCTVYVSLTPKATGALTANLSIASNAPGSPASVNLAGTGTASVPVVFLSEASMVFADTVVGSSSSQTMYLSNVGTVNLNVGALAISGTNAGDFSVSWGCGSSFSIAPGNSCSLYVQFNPKAAGVRTATLNIESNAGAAVTVALKGFAIRQLVISQSSLAFNNQAVNASSAANQVTLTNAGLQPVQINSVTTTGTDPAHFRVSSDCPASLGAGAVCGITVWFHPKATGARAATVEIVWWVATASPRTVTFALSGTGVAASSTPAPAIAIYPGFITTIAGGGATNADGVPATQAQLVGPSRLLLDASGNLYVSDSDFYTTGRVRRIDPTGVIHTIAGASGAADGSGDGGPALSAGINVASMSFDQNGNIVILDRNPNENWVRRINLSNGTISHVAGTGIPPNYGDPSYNDGIAASGASFFSPSAIASDGQGNIYVLDEWTCRVRKIGAASGMMSTVVGTMADGYYPGCPVNTPAIGEQAGQVGVDFGLMATAPSDQLQLGTWGNPLTSTESSFEVDLGSDTVSAIDMPTMGEQVAFDAAGDEYYASGILGISYINPQGRAMVTMGNENGDSGVSQDGDDGPVTAANLNLLGIAVDPALNVYVADNSNSRVRMVSPNAAPLQFGGNQVGVASTKEVTISNGGAASLEISGIAVQGTNASDFIFTASRHCNEINPGAAACSIAVTFTPSDLENRTATLVITDNAPGSPHLVQLNGRGTSVPEAGLTFSSNVVNFSSQALGTASQPMAIQVTNKNAVPLSFAAKWASGALGSFSEKDTCGKSLAPGATCTINLVFEPESQGELTASLDVLSQLPEPAEGAYSASNVSDAAISLSGEGVAAPSFLVTPAALTFSVSNTGAASQAQTVKVFNGGSAPLKMIFSPTVNGTDASDFLIQGSSCGQTIGAGNGCSIDLVFNPGSIGVKTAYLAFTDNGPGGIQSIALLGSTGTPAVAISAASLNLGSSVIGKPSAARTVTVSNTGPALLQVSGITVTGTDAQDFSHSSTCGAPVYPGASCGISVVFTPRTGGSRTATLTLTDNAAASPQKIDLLGTGLLPPCAAPVFSPIAGNYSTARSVTLTDATAGAAMYYTTDGTTPTTSSQKYVEPVSVMTSETIKAIGAASGYADSATATAAFKIGLPAAATPTLSPAAGTYGVTQSVTLADSTKGATIYYTADGSAPTTKSTKYTGPILVVSTETIKAIAASPGNSNSATASATYTIQRKPPSE